MKKTTLQDVANEAQVSIATVSRTVKNPLSVKKDTRERVKAAILKTGYRCTLFEQETSEPVVVIVYPISNAVFHSEIIQAACDYLTGYGYQCVALPTADNHILDQVNAFCSTIHPAGLIFLSRFLKQEFDQLIWHVPIIQCCEYDDQIDSPIITINDYFAAKLAVEYLITRGKKRIGFVTSAYPDYRYSIDRYRGYCDALNEAKRSPDPRYVHKIRNIASYDTAFAVASNLLSSSDRPDAIFAVSDVVGAAFVQAANMNRISIPGELSVIGFDNTMFSRICSPMLTTISQPRAQMGNLAAEMLLEKIRNPSLPNAKVVLDTEFVIRGTA